jgi:hypothetical protein
MKKLVAILGMAVALVGFMTLNAQATTITGGISLSILSADASLTGGSTDSLQDNTGFNFSSGANAFVTAGTGTFSGLAGLPPTDASFQSFTFAPLTSGTELWTLTTTKGVIYTFDMSNVTVVRGSNAGESLSLTLSGTGTFKDSLGDSANGTWNLQVSSSGSGTSEVFSYQSTAGVPVPEPATLLLLGAGMTGLGIYRSRRNKKA